MAQTKPKTKSKPKSDSKPKPKPVPSSAQVPGVGIFQPAVRRKLRLTVGIDGPSGAGKTVGALRLAVSLAGGDWSKVFFIDTDDESALAYVGNKNFKIGQFMHTNLRSPFDPRRAAKAGRLAVDAGAQVIVLDSMTEFWDGTGGFRDLHYRAGGDWGDYGKVNHIWQELVDWIVHESRCHVIVCCRSKMKRQLEAYTDRNGNERWRVNTLGLEPVVRPGFEYNLRLWLSVERASHLARVFTSRGDMPLPKDEFELNQELGEALRGWSEAGEGEFSEATDRLGDLQATQKAAPKLGSDMNGNLDRFFKAVAEALPGYPLKKRRSVGAELLKGAMVEFDKGAMSHADAVDLALHDLGKFVTETYADEMEARDGFDGVTAPALDESA